MKADRLQRQVYGCDVRAEGLVAVMRPSTLHLPRAAACQVALGGRFDRYDGY